MIINLICDMIIVVGVGVLAFQLYLFVTLARLKRTKKLTDKKEARLNQMIVNMRAISAILLIVACATLIIRVIQNM